MPLLKITRFLPVNRNEKLNVHLVKGKILENITSPIV